MSMGKWVSFASSMQVERLVRKMLLKLSSVAFPITLNPAYQLPGGTRETVEPRCSKLGFKQ